MDPCRFVRLVVGNLALKFPSKAAPAFSCCYCVVKLKNFPSQTATVPMLPPDHRLVPDAHLRTPSACFYLSQIDALKLASKPSHSLPRLQISVYAASSSSSSAACGLFFRSAGKLLGSLSVPLDLKAADSKPLDFYKGWASVGAAVEMHLTVRAEPDPRFVFKFGGDPECSPQVFQIQGNIKQPVFTCKFSFRNPNPIDRSKPLSRSRSWLKLQEGRKEQAQKERKGWSVTVHDLSGSPVAAASMVTPFVPSPGSDRVSRSNPGAWLILRPGSGAWKPWGRLEAWRDRGSAALGYRFQLLSADGSGATGITLAEAVLAGGRFTVDDMATSAANSPFSSPGGSFDLGSGSWSGSGSGSGSGSWGHANAIYRGFVMSATVDGGSGPEVEVGVEHVTCTEDAAVFVALAAAVDLSVDACRLFSQKLRKELRQQPQECVV